MFTWAGYIERLLLYRKGQGHFVLYTFAMYWGRRHYDERLLTFRSVTVFYFVSYVIYNSIRR